MKRALTVLAAVGIIAAGAVAPAQAWNPSMNWDRTYAACNSVWSEMNRQERLGRNPSHRAYRVAVTDSTRIWVRDAHVRTRVWLSMSRLPRTVDKPKLWNTHRGHLLSACGVYAIA